MAKSKNFQNGLAIGFALKESGAVLEPLTATENGTFTPESGVDGFSSVDVNVPQGYPDNYIKINKYATTLTSMFYNADLPEELTLDVSEAQINGFKQVFQSSYKHDLKKLTIIGDLSQVTDYSYFVYARNDLKSIEGVIDFSSATNVNNMFVSTAIENATFAPNTLKINLNISTVTTASDEMLISLANCLSNTTKATLSLSAASYNKCAAIYGTVDDDMFFTRTDNTSDVNLVDFISDAAYKGWQLTHS